MSDTAFQRKYRQEFIAQFEKRQSLVRNTVTTETEINGNEAYFLVAGSNGATAVTRGVNGDIPTRPDYLVQPFCTLKEWHDVPERTRFNIYASQGDGRRIMQMTSMSVINRKVDEDIHTALDAATQTQDFTDGTPDTASFFADIREIVATMGENNATETEPFALITPAFYANLMGLDQFTNVNYINDKPFENVAKSRAFNWFGMNWIVDSALPGVGTSSATCFFYNRAAIGHACDMERITTVVGYDEKNDKSWARTSAFMGSKVLQDSGIIKATHDDTTILSA